jgi:hypothetical protein
MKALATFVGLGTVAFFVSGAFPDDVFGQSKTIGDPEIAGPMEAEHGAWRTKAQQLFDPATRMLSRRLYVVWDPAPSRNRDFAWSPDNPAADRVGRINGNGRLIWRTSEKPSYDPSSSVAEYRGTFRGGRIDGSGAYFDHTGLTYEGHWKGGLPHGQGTLKLANGDEYAGEFRNGKANGTGRYIDTTGEIYEGAFAGGRKDGRGVTTLPNGRTYGSLWIAGQEVESSRFVRVAQAGGRNLPGSADDIRISINVDKRLPRGANADAEKFWYTSSNSATAVQIRPQDSRFMDMWKGKGELQLTWADEQAEPDFGILSVSEQSLTPLNLRIEVQNRSNHAVQVAGVYLDVQNSSGDNKPAIQARVGTGKGCEGGADYRAGFTLENFGWGVAEGSAVRFSLSASGAANRPTAFNVTKNLGNIDRTAEVDLESDLKAAGIATDYLKELTDGFVCTSSSREDPQACLKEMRATGKLGTLAEYVGLEDGTFILKMRSVLEYSWHDSKNTKHDWSHPFTASIPLGFVKSEVECGEGGGPQIISTKPQQFKVDASTYRIPVAFKTAISPGGTKPLILPVEAGKSSQHEFAVVVQINDGREIKSRRIELTYYKPRWFRKPPPLPSEDENPVFNNYDLIGTDMRQLRNSSEGECTNACETQPTCRGYSFDKWNGWCFLKSVVNSMRLDPQDTSGLKKLSDKPSMSTAAKGMERYRNKGFSTKDAYRLDLNSAFDECEQHCTNDDACVAFTFKKSARECYSFEQVDKYSVNADADSGVKRQPAP